MDNRKLYDDISKRTGGDIYIGVVGPVRTGKSTFIKRFMETLVIPRINNEYKRERARDELPQSGSGRTIMTAEPKFVPEEAVDIPLDGGGKFSVRLVDCVGYMVDGAVGQDEDGQPRMVTTPWFDHEIPMSEAAEIGTTRVIGEHSTIGVVITTDGTITDLPRESYLEAEDRTMAELQALGKPFVVLVNSANPGGITAQALSGELAEKYGVTTMAVNCLELNENDILGIIQGVLNEFPLEELEFTFPTWVDALSADSEIKQSLFTTMITMGENLNKIRDLRIVDETLCRLDSVTSTKVDNIDLGTGMGLISLDFPRELFYDTISAQAGFDIKDDGGLLTLLTSLSRMKGEYDKVGAALEQVRATGYGIVMPRPEEMTLEQPEIIRTSGSYGVRMRASAPSIHMIKADIKTEINPIVGNEKQSEDMMNYLLGEFADDTGRLWESNIFGKSLFELVTEGVNSKLIKMPEEARFKLRDTLGRIINEGSGGLICIIL